MPDWLHITGVIVLFLLGLRLSFFFSGSETGFYRLSLPRLGIDAQAGDRVARRMLWFAQRPSYFVATTLVGNNIANYLITVAITEGALLTLGRGSEAIEIASTLLFAPVIYLFGELLPKSVYYRAPLDRMRREIDWFYGAYLLSLPATTPLVLMTRAVERLAGPAKRAPELLPGRGRFLQMVSHGHREGLLTRAQSLMATGVLRIATERAIDSMTPSQRVLGLSQQAEPADVAFHARKYGTPVVVLHDDTPAAARDATHWTSYLRISDLLTGAGGTPATRHPLPRIPATATKLEALRLLHEHSAAYGALIDPQGLVLGTISQRGLIEQLFRPPPGAGSRSGDGLPADRST
jgi:putative hemolysin